MRYVAFLLGINVGKRQVKMEPLRELLEEMGYRNVKTILASGNVVFDSDQKDHLKLKETLEEKLSAKFGFTIQVIVREFESLQELARRQPFKGIPVTDQTRLYVTFLSEKPINTSEIPGEEFRVLKVTDTEVLSVKILKEGSGTVDAMAILTKMFGKNITTRNWNTIERLLTS